MFTASCIHVCMCQCLPALFNSYEELIKIWCLDRLSYATIGLYLLLSMFALQYFHTVYCGLYMSGTRLSIFIGIHLIPGL